MKTESASEQTTLFSILDAKKEPKRANSGFVSDEDVALSRQADRDGYDLDKLARVYSVSEKGGVTNLWIMTTRDAMRVCSHPRSHGVLCGSEWFYCWTQHDLYGDIDKRKKPKFKDDGRLKKWEGLEDIKIIEYL